LAATVVLPVPPLPLAMAICIVSLSWPATLGFGGPSFKLRNPFADVCQRSGEAFGLLLERFQLLGLA
jgi:hypothetical protein